MLALYRFASRWPLALLHALGAALGWLTWAASPTYRRRITENARRAGYRFADVRACVAQAGRMATETPRLWFGAPVPVQRRGVAHLDGTHGVFLSTSGPCDGILFVRWRRCATAIHLTK